MKNKIFGSHFLTMLIIFITVLIFMSTFVSFMEDTLEQTKQNQLGQKDIVDNHKAVLHKKINK